MICRLVRLDRSPGQLRMVSVLSLIPLERLLIREFPIIYNGVKDACVFLKTDLSDTDLGIVLILHSQCYYVCNL